MCYNGICSHDFDEDGDLSLEYMDILEVDDYPHED
jgi:hypothetical protein